MATKKPDTDKQVENLIEKTTNTIILVFRQHLSKDMTIDLTQSCLYELNEGIKKLVLSDDTRVSWASPLYNKDGTQNDYEY